MDQCWEYKIEVLSEQLRSLRITEETTSEETTEYMDNMSTASANTQDEQTGLSKEMVLDPGWFNRNRIKFED